MEEGAEQPGKLGKILKIGFIVLNLVCIGLGGYLVYASTIGYKSPSVSSAELDKELNEFTQSLQSGPVIYTLENFNTNLDGVPRRLIRLGVNLEMLDAEGFEEVMGLGPQARDSIMHILNGKRYSDIATVQGKLHLKNEITTKINSFLDRGVVKNVYFTDFVVQ